MNIFLSSQVESKSNSHAHQLAIFDLQEISKVHSHIVPIRIFFKMYNIIADSDFKDAYQQFLKSFIDHF